MFKRYKNPFDKELSNSILEEESTQTNSTHLRSTPYTNEKNTYSSSTMKETPPRIFEESQQSPMLNTPKSNYHSSFDAPLEAPQDLNLSDKKPTARPPQRKTPSQPYPIPNSMMLNDEPDTTIGEGVIFKGELTFDKLLRIDGHFEGDLLSEGKLIVGPKGVVKSNVKMREAVIEGKLEGNITVTDRIELRGDATINGNIKARYISVDEGVTIIGHVAVRPEEEEEPQETAYTQNEGT